jgi:hypothetical protein
MWPDSSASTRDIKTPVLAEAVKDKTRFPGTRGVEQVAGEGPGSVLSILVIEKATNTVFLSNNFVTRS